MKVNRIRHPKIYEEIAKQLKDNIVGGELQPGDKLPSTRELSELYGVGMSTVREALSALKAMGLVESRQGEGSYVKSSSGNALPALDTLLLNKQTIIELLEVRKSLETAVAGIAAEKRTEEDVQELRRIVTTMESCVGDEQAGELADIQFHQTLARATHNTMMATLLDTIAGQMETAIRETRRLQLYANISAAERLLNDHQTIFAAVEAGDREAAAAAMHVHLHYVEAVLQQYLG